MKLNRRQIECGCLEYAAEIIFDWIEPVSYKDWRPLKHCLDHRTPEEWAEEAYEELMKEFSVGM